MRRLTGIHRVARGGGCGVQRPVLLAVHAAQHHVSWHFTSHGHRGTHVRRATLRRHMCARAADTLPATTRPAPRCHWPAPANRRASFRTLSFFHVAFYLKRVDASLILPDKIKPYLISIRLSSDYDVKEKYVCFPVRSDALGQRARREPRKMRAARVGRVRPRWWERRAALCMRLGFDTPLCTMYALCNWYFLCSLIRVAN